MLLYSEITLIDKYCAFIIKILSNLYWFKFGNLFLRILCREKYNFVRYNIQT